MTKHASTFFLKAVLVALGLFALLLVVLMLWYLVTDAEAEWAISPIVLYVGLGGICATIVPFLLALYQAWLLLRNIDTNNPFSQSSLDALRTIKRSAIAMTFLYLLAMPLAYVVADLDDAPGLVLYSFVFACAPLVIATFAAVLQKLVHSALSLKTENDLTV